MSTNDDSLLPPTHSSLLANYGGRVRAAHELADLLKRTRPNLHERVTHLQGKVTACQQTLDEAKEKWQQAPIPLNPQSRKQEPAPELDQKSLLALQELENTTQALLDLRQKVRV